jgi:hypothetical protein
MESENHHLEENTARLIRESYSSRVRLDPQLHGDMLRRLRAVSGTHRKKVEFPDGALLGLTGVLALMVVWLMVQVLSGQLILTSAPLTILAVIVVLNLILVPVASMVIVIRRRHAQAG